ncbi:MAG: metal ABC transporter permease [Parachlamydiaceae bacterium]|nr:metal ABC transporter permease [Parachlamydiaceae bacterium]
MDLTPLSLFFSDPVLRAPTIGCMLMCLTAGLVGAIVFLRKQSLIGEALSHASYPGVVLGVLFTGVFFSPESDDTLLSFFILIGASFTALLGLWLIHLLEKKLKVPSDAALCFILATFFGIGLTIASEVQFSFTTLYKKVQVYLYGQAATMTDIHILIYGVLACVVICMVFFLYKELQIITFDRSYAKSLGIRTKPIDTVLFVLVVLAVIIGIRSVGVVLMSAMLIAPPVAARQFTNRLSMLFILSALFGVISGFLGNYSSVEITHYMSIYYPGARIVLPTGPMIVLVASFICLLALLLAPKRGLLLRVYRVILFRYQCMGENILKDIWRRGSDVKVHFNEILKNQDVSKLYLKFILWRMVANGWIEKNGAGVYSLTTDGSHRAAKIVRLHRLWEVYLVDYLEVGVERVHRNAEEMEHIITPDLERELTFLLNDPKRDPHQQPIPPQEETRAF